MLFRSDLTAMPLEEGAKLLLNRGTGLWLAREKLHCGLPDPTDADFVVRNLWKAVLACGDAALISRHAYEATLTDRIARIKELAVAADWVVPVEWYCRAAEFKWRPRDYQVAEIGALWEPVLRLFQDSYLDFFRRYYGRSIADMKELQQLVFRLDPPDADRSLRGRAKNMALNLMIRGGRRFDWRHYQRYPRFILFTVFPGLLFDSCLQPDYISLLPGVTYDSTPDEVAAAYLKLWSRFN